jgi:hypothetical protein
MRKFLAIKFYTSILFLKPLQLLVKIFKKISYTKIFFWRFKVFQKKI